MQEKNFVKGTALTATGAYLFVASILLFFPSMQVALAVPGEAWSTNLVFMTANVLGTLLLACLSGTLIHFGGVVQGRPQIDGRPNKATIVYCGRTAIATCAVLTVLCGTVIMSGPIESVIGLGGLSVLMTVEKLALWACMISSLVGLLNIRKALGPAAA